MNRTFADLANEKYKAIEASKKSYQNWLVFWAQTKCPYQVGDEVEIYGHDIEVSFITAFYSTNCKDYIWIVKGWGDTGKEYKELCSFSIPISKKERELI